MTSSQAESSTDAVIIGAGAIGTAIAYELARRGVRTTSIDALPAAGYGSTSSSSAIVRFSYSTFPGVAMAWEGVHYWLDWATYVGEADESGLARFVQAGMVLLKEPGGHHERCVPLYDQVGVPYEEWDADELRRRMPALDPSVFGPPASVDDDAFWADPQAELPGAIWTPGAGYVNDPQLASHNLQSAAQQLGARFRFSTTVTAIETAAGRVRGVRLSDGSTIAAPVVVNVAGPHSGAVNALAGLTDTMRIGTRPLRHEVHQVPGPPGSEGVSCPVADGDTGVYLRPEVGAQLLVGSLDPACDGQEWVDDPDDFNRRVTAAQFERQVLRAARRIPALTVPNEHRGVAALYDVSDDWIPVYDRTDLDGFYVAIGTSGNQFKNAGIAGHCMAELIGAVQGGRDHDSDPLVVRGPYTGLPIDMGAFSRNRPVHPGSSFSVHG